MGRGIIKNPDVSHDEALKHLHYDPKTGHITLRQAAKRTDVGRRIGYPTSYGYRAVRVRALMGAVSVQEHRLVWFLHYGRWPEGIVDHIDEDRSHNAIHNLREVDAEFNTRRSMDKDSPIRGVTTDPNRRGNKKWEAFISLHGKYYRVGLYHSKEEALIARAAALKVKDILLGSAK